MSKKLSVFAPHGKWIEFEVGKESVSGIYITGDLATVVYTYMDGETKVISEVTYSGIPFIFTDYI